MNNELKKLVLRALDGDNEMSRELLGELWFQLFCQKFAHILLDEAEKAIAE